MPFLSQICVCVCVLAQELNQVSHLILHVSVIATFFWVVIYSYYRQVEEEKNGPYGTVNHTYGIPDGQVQILQPQDQKGICPSPTKVE